MITDITFETVAGGQQTLKVQDYEDRTVIEQWSDADRAVSGKLRHNIKGTRQTFTLRYDHCLEPSAYRTLFNNITADLTGGEDEFVISEGADLSNAVVVTLTDESRYQMEYTETIGTFAPGMEFKAVSLDTLAGSYYEEGYIEPGYIE